MEKSCQILNRVILAALAVLAGLAVSAQAATSGLYNTGVDSTGTPLADGTIGDPHYRLIAVPSGSTMDIRVRTSVGSFPIPPWLGDDTSSTWIGPNNDAWLSGPNGSYIYRTTFNVTGPLSTATISGGWATDDPGIDILLNGASTGNANVLGYSGWTPFSITGGFVAGLNTLDFLVDQVGSGPTGLRVEMNGAVPEPTTMLAGALLLLPFGASAVRRLRRKQV